MIIGRDLDSYISFLEDELSEALADRAAQEKLCMQAQGFVAVAEKQKETAKTRCRRLEAELARMRAERSGR